MGGELGARLDYALSFELTKLTSSGAAPLRDFYFDMKYSPSFNVRVGQAKVAYTRSFLASSRDRDFIELTEMQERQRYDRDIGVWAFGGFFDQRLRYYAGVSNGAGPNQLNDNVDMLLNARFEGVAMGEYIRPGFGDHLSTETPSLTLGLAMAHDMVRLGPAVGGIEVGNRDVDGDGVLDGTDNFETRFLLNDVCIRAGVPWVYGACVGAYGLALAAKAHDVPLYVLAPTSTIVSARCASMDRRNGSP